MTFEFEDFATEIQSDELTDERISDEELAEAGEFYDELEMHLDAMDEILDYHDLNAELDALDEKEALSDAEWDEHWEAFDDELHSGA